MKKLTYILLLFLKTAYSQPYVYVPDPNFRNWLQNNYSAAMISGSLNVSHIWVTSASFLSVSNNYISDLTGVQYFTNIRKLYCNQNNLTILPALPNSLKHIECQNNPLSDISSLLALPSLTLLACNNCSLTSLSSLPNSLVSLVCHHNQLNSISQLPDSLLSLWCSANSLTSLPPLPNKLKYLTCQANSLSNLPSLPGGLVDLHCEKNSLTSLPNFPNTLTWLYCDSNQLVSIPAIINTSLKVLSCKNNSLVSIPPLNAPLQGLYCDNNYLTTLPQLCFNGMIHLYNLSAANNNITCLPYLDGSTHYTLTNNPFNCVPNYVWVPSVPTLTIFPLCGTGNAFGCSVATYARDYSLKNNIKVYPNPALKEIYFENAEIQGRFEIFSIEGKSVLSGAFDKKINIEGLCNGVYYLKVYENEISTTTKITIVH